MLGHFTSLALKSVEDFFLALVTTHRHFVLALIPLGVHCLRLTMATRPPETILAHYLSFMFTLLVGELKHLQCLCSVWGVMCCFVPWWYVRVYSGRAETLVVFVLGVGSYVLLCSLVVC